MSPKFSRIFPFFRLFLSASHKTRTKHLLTDVNMKRKCELVALLFLVSFIFLPHVSAAAPTELVVMYSDVSPSIDGTLGAEWNDTTSYVVYLNGTTDIEAWIYLKHNGTFIYIGVLVWNYQIHTVDQLSLFFDEGDDGGHGSGTRDYTLTPNQEDLKSCQTGSELRDGCYKTTPTQFHAFTVEIDFTASCAHENDHPTTVDEIEYWEGLTWVDDHWEWEFAIPFIGNDAGTDDVSDLNCTRADTLGFKIQYFTTGPENYYYPAESQNEVNTYANLGFSPLPTIESCNASGLKKDSFDLGDPVYVNGSGYAASTAYDCYIVYDVPSWTDGMIIPPRIPDTATTISSDALGNILPLNVWNDPQTIGQYDTVVDINGNGLYDVNVDVLDNDDILVTAGFIIPEFATLLPFLMVWTLIGVTIYRRRRQV
jgi:hypothetical protein